MAAGRPLRNCSLTQIERANLQPMVREAVSWDDLRVFLAVHQRGSHGGAARLLGVDPTTVGRRIAGLERALGARLFDRTPAGLEPTPAGAALHARAARVEEEVLAAERELGGADARVTGSVRLTASDGLLHAVVLPAIEALRRAHPDLLLELRADTRELDLSRREADVALRLARPKQPSLVAVRLGAMHMGLYASRGYLARRGTPRSAADLAAHDFIGFDASLDDVPQVRWLRRLVRAPRWVVRATTVTPQVIACAEGAGLALLAAVVAQREPRLVPVLPSLAPRPREVWGVVHQDLRRSARVIAVLDWLRSAASQLDA
jgi:DNA-binding transcriptional LysR family regulator